MRSLLLSLELTSKILGQRYLSSSPVVASLTVQKQIKLRAKIERDWSKKTAVEAYLLEQKKQLSATEWKSIAEDHELTLTNVGNILMTRLLENGQSDPVLNSHAENFVKKFSSVPVLSRYILLQKTEQDIFLLYEKIKSLVKGVWSVEIAERIAIALSRTSRWREIGDLIDSVKVGGNPTNAMYSAYAKAAFLNEDFNLGWEISQRLKSSCEAMEAFLQKCPQVPGKEEEEGVKIFQQYIDQEMEMSLVQKLFEFYTKLGYDCKLSSRVWRGSGAFCTNCKQEIREEMTDEEFSKLKTKFYENVMKGGDVYINSTPAELQQFLRFCEAKAPYDIVVDGLNAAMIPKGKNILPRIIESFLPSKKVLVIGRKHMDRQWKNLQLRLRGQPVDFYFLNDDSQDDVFMLYACFMSGPRTKLVSRDMLRDHLFRLGETEGPTFRKWLRLNQLNAEVIGVKVRIFGSEGRFLQWKEGKGGHVPVKIVQNEEESQRNDREVWACFRKNSKK